MCRFLPYVIYNINVSVKHMFATVLNANSVAFYLTQANVRFLPPHSHAAVVVANERQQGYDQWNDPRNDVILSET